jgi:hypothetical protein
LSFTKYDIAEFQSYYLNEKHNVTSVEALASILTPSSFTSTTFRSRPASGGFVSIS